MPKDLHGIRVARELEHGRHVWHVGIALQRELHQDVECLVAQIAGEKLRQADIGAGSAVGFAALGRQHIVACRGIAGNGLELCAQVAVHSGQPVGRDLVHGRDCYGGRLGEQVIEGLDR